MMQDYILKNIIPAFNSLRGMDLLKDYVRQWKNFTILVHFMRKLLNYLVIGYAYLIGSLLPEEQQPDASSANSNELLQG